MKSGSIYRPDIDGLRAIAVLSVMIYHLHGKWLSGGFVGVDVFFVISGFVVTGSLAASKAESLFSFISEFYARRLARILPALLFVLVASSLLSTLFIPPSWLSRFSDTTALHAFFGLSNWVMQRNEDNYFTPKAELNPYTHTWSLGVEEQFYVIVPILVYFWARAVRRSNNDSLAARMLIVLTAASLAACIWASKVQPAAAFYFIGCRLWELAFGALLYLITDRFQKFFYPFQQKFGWLGRFAPWLGLVLVAVAFSFADAKRFPWPWALLPTIGTMLLIGGVNTVPVDFVRRTLASKLMVWIGKRSYSLYLWHWPVFVLMRWTVGLHTALFFTIAVIATFLLAEVSYRIIERPLRHNPWIEKNPRWLRITGFVLLPIIGCFISSYFFDHRQQISFSRVVRNTTDWYAKDSMPYENVGKRYFDVDMQQQKFAGGVEISYVPKGSGVKVPGKKMSVLGDSHATALRPIFEQISAELGITVSVYSLVGCSYIDFKNPVKNNPTCFEFNQAIMNKTVATSNPGDIVFLPSLRLDRYGAHNTSFNIPDMYAKMYNSETMKLRDTAYEDAKDWIKPFTDRQLNVIFSAPTPIFKSPQFRCSDWFNKDNPICIEGTQQPRSVLEKLRKPILDSMSSLAEEFPGVHVWDAFPVLCPDEICFATRDGRPLFFDGDHISAFGNLILYPYFKKVIDP